MISEQETLEWANKIREGCGGSIIGALLPALPSQSKACLIAKALNFDCEVDSFSIRDPETDRVERFWRMKVEDEALAQKAAAVFGTDYTFSQWLARDSYFVRLPKELGTVAATFDALSNSLHYLYSVYGPGSNSLRKFLKENKADLWLTKYMENLPGSLRREVEKYL